MPLELQLKRPTSIPIEVDAVTVEAVRECAADQVRALPVQYGNKRLQLADFFTVDGSARDDEHIVWIGDCSKVKLIGSCMSRGKMTVEGNAGMHLGAEMTGGEIEVRGHANDWAGAEMHGGRIRVRGNAGHCVGAVYRGGRRGMTGGEILIDGDAGNEIGHTMRRGLIAIAGKAGDAIGFNMLAGTVVAGGATGIRHGAGMRRGTIVLLAGETAAPLLPTFKFASVYCPVFLRVYLLHLMRAGFGLPPDCLDAFYARYCGDFLEQGRGEILIRQPVQAAP
jgi:formylmethanofuran dehydrogenase subunit C